MIAKVEQKWHVMTCPGCRGKGGDDDYDEWIECYICKGKGLVKVDLDELCEYRPGT